MAYACNDSQKFPEAADHLQCLGLITNDMLDLNGNQTVSFSLQRVIALFWHFYIKLRDALGAILNTPIKRTGSSWASDTTGLGMSSDEFC